MRLMKATLATEVYFVTDAAPDSFKARIDGLAALLQGIQNNGIADDEIDVAEVRATDDIDPEWMESLPWGAPDERRVSGYMQELIAAAEMGQAEHICAICGEPTDPETDEMKGAGQDEEGAWQNWYAHVRCGLFGAEGPPEASND